MDKTTEQCASEITRLWVSIAELRKDIAHQDKALELQAREYERRLQDLNHAHAQAQEALRTYVSQVVYDNEMKAISQDRVTAGLKYEQLDYLKTSVAALSTKVDNIGTWKNQSTGKVTAAEWVIRILLMVITLIVSILGTRFFVGG